MRRRALIPVFMLIAVACAEPTTVATPPTQAPHSFDEGPTSVRVVEPTVEKPPVWQGFSETDGPPATTGLAAYSRRALQVYESPDAGEPWTTLEPLTILGTTTVLGVVGEPVDGWVEVMLPVRPNGSTGWVRTDDVWLYVADGEIVVDLGARRLTYLVDGVSVLETDIGIGSEYNRTPTGSFFVTDSVSLSNPNGAWGPHALGLSARSDSITSFNGGDGIIGIHGTNNPGSIGGNISLGCVRLPNDMITALYEMVPLGTKVEIRA